MTTITKTFFTLLYFAVFIPFSIYTKTLIQQAPSRLVAANYGDDLSDLSLTSTEGKADTLKDLVTAKKLTLLQLWATWCAQCRLELPHLAKMYLKEGYEDLQVLAVSVESEREPVLSYVGQMHLPFPTFYDPSNALSRRLNVQGVPIALLLDDKAKVLMIIPSGTEIDLPMIKLWLNQSSK